MKHGKEQQRHTGFSLIEVVISMGIIALIGVVIVRSFTSTIRTNAKTEILRDIKQNGDFALGYIVHQIQNAQEITCSPYADCSGAISYVIAKDENADLIQLKPLAGTPCRIVAYNATDATTLYLTSDTVALNPCSITYSVQTLYGRPSRVSVTFTVTQVNTAATNTVDIGSMVFRTTTQVRNVDL